jgi:hypothetical protein
MFGSNYNSYARFANYFNEASLTNQKLYERKTIIIKSYYRFLCNPSTIDR